MTNIATETEERFWRHHWGLLGEWWCVTLDLTTAEEEVMLETIRDANFAGQHPQECSLEFIRDRLYGGFPCGNDEHRRHVYFNSGQYSYMAASEGRFWANDGRGDCWQELDENNVGAAAWIGGGPFTEGKEE